MILALTTTAVILFSALQRHEYHPDAMWQGKGCTAPLRDLSSLGFLAVNKSVVVDISDEFQQMWAIYYMRQVNTVLPDPVGYLAMPHIRPFLARSRPVGSFPVIGRLGVGVDPEAIWSDGVFSLVPADRPQIVEVSNPNGLEWLDGAQFVWVGPDPLSLKVAVPRRGRYIIRAERFVPGPSAPEKPTRSVKVDQGTRSFLVDVDAHTTGIPVELNEGESTINISCLDRVTVRRLSNGDIRPLLLGIRRLSLVPEDSKVK
jgi:hypothetical protein